MSKMISDFKTPPRKKPENVEILEESHQPAESPYMMNEPQPPRESLPPVIVPATTAEPEPPKKPRRRWRPRFTKKRVIISAIIVLILAIAGVFVYLNYTAGKITDGGTILDLIAPGAPLKTDSEGRTNILIFGTSQDDAAHQDADGGGGLWLSDSIMLVSLDKDNNTAKMVSIPRDLWVQLADQCSVGNSSKINAVYECGGGLVDSSSTTSNYASKDKAGATALMDTITTVTGITPQYYVHVNYSVLQQAVDAVGGIDVNIQGDGADGIYDTNFDWNCGTDRPYTCKNVYYPKDGEYHLDGLHALYLARARGDAGAYSYKDFGLAKGDFDRQMNQQKILTALKTKAQSAGVLANPVKVVSLLNALGNNVTTDISTSEMKTFLTTMKKLEPNDIKSVDLDGDTPVVKTGEYDGQSIVLATSGVYDYSSIISLVAKELSTNPATNEDATIAVYNGGDTAGSAAKLQTQLESGGLNVTTVGNTSAVGSDSYTIYAAKPDSFPKTVDYLTQTLKNAQVISTAAPSTIPANTADIVIVINH